MAAKVLAYALGMTLLGAFLGIAVFFTELIVDRGLNLAGGVRVFGASIIAWLGAMMIVALAIFLIYAAMTSDWRSSEKKREKNKSKIEKFLAGMPMLDRLYMSENGNIFYTVVQCAKSHNKFDTIKNCTIIKYGEVDERLRQASENAPARAILMQINDAGNFEKLNTEGRVAFYVLRQYRLIGTNYYLYYSWKAIHKVFAETQIPWLTPTITGLSLFVTFALNKYYKIKIDEHQKKFIKIPRDKIEDITRENFDKFDIKLVSSEIELKYVGIRIDDVKIGRTFKLFDFESGDKSDNEEKLYQALAFRRNLSAIGAGIAYELKLPLS